MLTNKSWFQLQRQLRCLHRRDRLDRVVCAAVGAIVYRSCIAETPRDCETTPPATARRRVCYDDAGRVVPLNAVTPAPKRSNIDCAPGYIVCKVPYPANAGGSCVPVEMISAPEDDVVCP